MTISKFKKEAEKLGDYISYIPKSSVQLINQKGKTLASINMINSHSYSFKNYTGLYEDCLVCELADTPISKR